MIGTYRCKWPEQTVHLASGLVHLYVVAVLLLHGFGKLLPVNTGLFCDWAKALGHATLHALEAAHVHVGLLVLHQFPQVISVFCHLRLNVHLLSGSILVLARNSVVKLELARVLLLVLDVLVVVEQGLGVGNAHKHPCKTLELASAICGFAGLVMEQQPAVGAHWGDAGAGGKHDDVGLRVLWKKHFRTSWASDKHIIAYGHVANMIGADTTVHLVVWVASACLVWLVLALLTIGILPIHFNDTLHTE